MLSAGALGYVFTERREDVKDLSLVRRSLDLPLYCSNGDRLIGIIWSTREAVMNMVRDMPWDSITVVDVPVVRFAQAVYGTEKVVV